MNKRLLSLLLTLALLLCAAAGLGEQTPGLSAARINALQKLAGENGADWHEGTPPTPDMNAFQMWQWTDWFLSSRVRSLLGAIQDYEQLNTTLYTNAENDRWDLRKAENILSRYEAQLEEDRLAILNGITRLEDDDLSQAERQTIYDRMLEAESEIRQIISAICGAYQANLKLVSECSDRLQGDYKIQMQAAKSDETSVRLADSAKALENAENRANLSFSVSALSTHQVGIRVLNSNKDPVPGAAVTVSEQTNLPAQHVSVNTDSEGRAVFWISDLGANETSDLKLSLRVEAGGCQTREIQTLRVRSGETRAIYLQDQTENSAGPYLVMCCFNGRDILNETNTYYCTKKNTLNHTFTVKLHCDTDGELELRYPVDAKGSEFKTVVKKFTKADSDKTVFKFEDQWLSKLPPGAKVSFAIKTGGKTYTTDTRIDIQKAMVEEPFFSKSALFSFTSGSAGIGFDIPGKVPFISGSRLAIDIPCNAPQVVYLPSHMAMFSLGYDFRPEQANWKSQDAVDQDRAIKAFEAKGKADKLLAKAGTYRNINTTAKKKMLGNYGASITPFASMQGLYRSSDQSLELRGDAGVTMSFKAEYTQTFTLGPVPFFLGVDFSMGVGFGLDITVATTLDVSGGMPKPVGGLKIGYGSGLSVSIRLDMGFTGGMGLKKVASISFRVYGYLNPIVHFTTPKVTAEAKVGMGVSVSMRLLFLKWSKTVWEGQLPLNQNAAPPSGALRPGGVNFQADSVGLEQTDLTPLTIPLDVAADDLQFAQIGTDTYLFWIQPGSTPDQAARLNWYNLSTMQNGVIAILQGQQSLRRGNNNAYADYAFSVEAVGDWCALTILSGTFSSSGSGDEPATPNAACVATVLMQRNDGIRDSSREGNLETQGYHEGPFFDQGVDYPIMPEVRLITNGSNDHSVLSAYSTAGNPERINSRLYEYTPDVPYDFGKGLEKKEWDMHCEDAAEINRYRIANVSASYQQTAFYALNEQGTLSRLSGTGTRNVLAQGGIVNFRVLTGTRDGKTTDRLFYLEQRMTEEGGILHRLKSVTVDPVLKITDYDIETSATCFDIVHFGGGIYLYWVETTTPEDSSSSSGYTKEYLVRCVRYDPGTDTVFGPFSLVELNNCPDAVKLMDEKAEANGTVTRKGYYATATNFRFTDEGVDTNSAHDQSYSLYSFGYDLICAVELTAATLSDPCVCPGDYTELAFAVKNSGNVPLSAIQVQIKDKDSATNDAHVQTLYIDLDDPELSVNSFQGTSHTIHTITGTAVMRRLGNLYDPLNQEDWTITDTTASGTTVRSVRTDLLMPGDTRSYQTKIQIPVGWAGRKTLYAEVFATGEPALYHTGTSANMLLRGAPEQSRATRLTSTSGAVRATRDIDTDAHDLMLTAQRIMRGGEDYVHITIRNRSGNTESDVTPVLISSFRGETLFTHEFVNAMGDDFGYAMDIPLKTLTKGRRLPELELYVGNKGGAGYEEFADSDNHVRLMLTTQLCIVEQPESIPASEGAEAVFHVAAAGGEKPYRYQWQRMIGVDRWADIPGENQDTYRIAPVKLEQNGMVVRCVVTDQFGDSVISDPATLSILPQTGDSSQPALWILLALSSAAVLAGIWIYKKHKA